LRKVYRDYWVSCQYLHTTVQYISNIMKVVSFTFDKLLLLLLLLLQFVIPINIIVINHVKTILRTVRVLTVTEIRNRWQEVIIGNPWSYK